MEIDEVKVVMIFKIGVGHLPKKLADNFVMKIAEQVGKTFEGIEGLKLIYLPTRNETDVYAIPLKAFMEGNINCDDGIKHIVDKCKEILSENEDQQEDVKDEK